MPCNAGCVHFPPTLGVSARVVVGFPVEGCGVVVVVVVVVAMPAVTGSRCGVEKIGAGGARWAADGGVYGLWKPDKLPPTMVRTSRQGSVPA